MLIGLTGTTHNNPIAGGGTTLINCKNVNPLVKDKQGLPMLDPCEAVITVNCPEPTSRRPASGIIVRWGTDGGAQELAIGDVGGGGAAGVNGPGKGTVFSPGICIPLKGSYFRLDCLPAPTGAVTPQIVASIAKGRCPPLQIYTHQPIAGGSVAPGGTQDFFIPAFAKRFRVTRALSGVVGLNAFTVSDASVGDWAIQVVNGAQMDWAPIAQMPSRNNAGSGRITVTNDDPGNNIQDVGVWWELSL